MPTAKVTWKGSKGQLLATLRSLPRILAGHAPDPHGIARAMQLRLGVALLSKIQQSFLVKARGGTGEDGITWQPLKRETIAQRRTTAAERKAAGLKAANKFRGLLTKAENERWKKIFGGRLQMLLIRGMGLPEAKARAAQIAWSILKSEGAKTKLALFGGRTVEILRDSGELFRSFTPGVDDKPSGADGQVFETPPGKVIVGTNKKPWHHAGIPGKLPARPFWPLDGSLPDAWWEALNETMQRGLLKVLADVLSRGP